MDNDLYTGRPGLRSNLPSLGATGVAPNTADAALIGERALNQIRGAGLKTPAKNVGGVLYSRSLGKFSVGGVEFGRDEYKAALDSQALINKPNAPKTPAADWMPVPLTDYSNYLRSIAEPRGTLDQIATGAQDLASSYVTGAGQFLDSQGAPETGADLIEAGQSIGLSEDEQARSAAIDANRSFSGKVQDAIEGSAPSLVTAVGSSLAFAKLGGAIGTIAGPVGTAIGTVAGGAIGLALSIFPSEYNSSFEEAKTRGLDTDNPDVQADIINTSVFKTAVQSVGAGVVVKAVSPMFKRLVTDATRQTASKGLTSAIAKSTAKKVTGAKRLKKVGLATAGGATAEGTAEALALVADKVVFDPELRKQLNDYELAILAPLVMAKYGEEVAISFLAGAGMAGPASGIGKLAEIRRDNKEANGLEGGITIKPRDEQAAMDPGEPVNLLGTPNGAPPSTNIPTPPRPTTPGFTEEAPQAEMFPTTQQLGVRPAGPIPPVIPPDTTPQQRQADLFPGQGELPFTPSEVGQDVATRARITGERLPLLERPVAPQPEELSRAEAEALGQQAFDFDTPTTMGSAFSEAMRASQAQQAAAEQAAEAARQAQQAEAAASAQRQTEVDAAEKQRAKQAGSAFDGKAAWDDTQKDLLKGRVVREYGDLNKNAQMEWNAAVAANESPTVLGNMYETMRGRVRKSKVGDEIKRRSAEANAPDVWEDIRQEVIDGKDPSKLQGTDLRPFEDLTAPAKAQWQEAVQKGTANAELYKKLRTRVSVQAANLRREAKAAADKAAADKAAADKAAAEKAKKAKKTATNKLRAQQKKKKSAEKTAEKPTPESEAEPAEKTAEKPTPESEAEPAEKPAAAPLVTKYTLKEEPDKAAKGAKQTAEIRKIVADKDNKVVTSNKQKALKNAKEKLDEATKEERAAKKALDDATGLNPDKLKKLESTHERAQNNLEAAQKAYVAAGGTTPEGMALVADFIAAVSEGSDSEADATSEVDVTETREAAPDEDTSVNARAAQNRADAGDDRPTGGFTKGDNKLVNKTLNATAKKVRDGQDRNSDKADAALQRTEAKGTADLTNLGNRRKASAITAADNLKASAAAAAKVLMDDMVKRARTEAAELKERINQTEEAYELATRAEALAETSVELDDPSDRKRSGRHKNEASKAVTEAEAALSDAASKVHDIETLAKDIASQTKLDIAEAEFKGTDKIPGLVRLAQQATDLIAKTEAKIQQAMNHAAKAVDSSATGNYTVVEGNGEYKLEPTGSGADAAPVIVRAGPGRRATIEDAPDPDAVDDTDIDGYVESVLASIEAVQNPVSYDERIEQLAELIAVVEGDAWTSKSKAAKDAEGRAEAFLHEYATHKNRDADAEETLATARIMYESTKASEERVGLSAKQAANVYFAEVKGLTVIKTAVEKGDPTLTTRERNKLLDADKAMKARVAKAKDKAEAEEILRSQYIGDVHYSEYLAPVTDAAFFNTKVVKGKRVIARKDSPKDGTGRTKLAGLDKVESPVNLGKAKMIAKTFMSKLAIKPKVGVFRNQADLKARAPKLYAAAAAARPQGDFDDMVAAGYSFDADNVLLFTDRMSDPAEVRMALAHEVLGHAGLRGLIDERRFNALMEEVYNLSPIIQSEVDMAMQSRGMSKAEATEEYLSDYAAVLDLNLIARVWRVIKDALNKIGVQFGDEGARYIVGQARRYAKGGSVQGQYHIGEMADRLYRMGHGEDVDGTGRFATVETMHGLGAAAGTMRPEYDLGEPNDFKRIMGDAADLWDRLKASTLSLSNYRAKQNPGLKRGYQLLATANRRAMAIKNRSNETMRTYLDMAFEVSGTVLTGGLRKAEKAQVDTLLMHTRNKNLLNVERDVAAAFKEDRRLKEAKVEAEMRSAGLDPTPAEVKAEAERVGAGALVYDEDGEVKTNKELIAILQEKGRLTFEEARDGFTITSFVESPLDDEGRRLIEEEKNAAVAKAEDEYREAVRNSVTPEDTDKATKARDRAVQQAERVARRALDAGTYQKPYAEQVPGVPDLKEDGRRWRAYKELRDAVDDVVVQHVVAKHRAHNKVVDGQMATVSEAMRGGLTDTDRAFLMRVNQRFSDMTTNEVSAAGTEKRAAAMKFLEDVNRAMLSRGTDLHDAVVEAFPESERDEIRRQLEDMKSRFEPNRVTRDGSSNVSGVQAPMDVDQSFVIQNAIKNISQDMGSARDGSSQAAENLAGAYIPFVRRGKFQVRMQAKDAAGNVLKVPEEFLRQMSFHQVETQGLADKLAADIRTLLVDDNGRPVRVSAPVWNSAEGRFVLSEDVRLDVVAEAALDSVAAPPQLNLNEFIGGLRRFGIALDTAKHEEVMVTLTKQNDSARKRLTFRNVPGADPDVGRAAAEFIEGQASIIAKTEVRPDLDRLMDRSIRETQELWNAEERMPDGTLKLDYLKNRYETISSDPSADKRAVNEARKAYHTYKGMVDATNRDAATGPQTRFGNRYYNELARTLTFMESQKLLDEADTDSGERVARLRSMIAMMQLGASLATASLNILSLPTNTQHYLAGYNEKTGFGGGFGQAASMAALFKAMKDGGIPAAFSNMAETSMYYKNLAEGPTAVLKRSGLTKDEAVFLSEQIANGVGQPALTNSLQSSARGRMKSGAWRKINDAIMSAFNRTEQASRRTALLAAYRLQYDSSKGAGHTDAEAQRMATDFAVMAVEDTLGEYSVLNRPATFRGHGLSLLYMYKVFPTMSVQLMRNLDRKSQMFMLGSLMLLSGLGGVPFEEDGEDLVDTVSSVFFGGRMPSIRLEMMEALDEFLPGLGDLVANGALNSWLGWDVGSRTAVGNMLPGTDLLLPSTDGGTLHSLFEILGPAGGFIEASLKMAGGLLGALTYELGLSDKPATIEDALRVAPATMVRSVADAVAYSTAGAVVDKRGYVLDRDDVALSVLGRVIGFYPAAVANQYRTIAVIRRMTAGQSEISAAFYNAYIQHKMAGNHARAREIKQEVRDFNKMNRDSGMRIRNFDKNANRRYLEAKNTMMGRTIGNLPKDQQGRLEKFVRIMGISE